MSIIKVANVEPDFTSMIVDAANARVTGRYCIFNVQSPGDASEAFGDIGIVEERGFVSDFIGILDRMFFQGVVHCVVVWGRGRGALYFVFILLSCIAPVLICCCSY